MCYSKFDGGDRCEADIAKDEAVNNAELGKRIAARENIYDSTADDNALELVEKMDLSPFEGTPELARYRESLALLEQTVKTPGSTAPVTQILTVGIDPKAVAGARPEVKALAPAQKGFASRLATSFARLFSSVKNALGGGRELELASTLSRFYNDPDSSLSAHEYFNRNAGFPADPILLSRRQEKFLSEAEKARSEAINLRKLLPEGMRHELDLATTVIPRLGAEHALKANAHELIRKGLAEGPEQWPKVFGSTGRGMVLAMNKEENSDDARQWGNRASELAGQRQITRPRIRQAVDRYAQAKASFGIDSKEAKEAYHEASNLVKRKHRFNIANIQVAGAGVATNSERIIASVNKIKAETQMLAEELDHKHHEPAPKVAPTKPRPTSPKPKADASSSGTGTPKPAGAPRKPRKRRSGSTGDATPTVPVGKL